MQLRLGAWYQLDGQSEAMQCHARHDDFWAFRDRHTRSAYVKDTDVAQKVRCLVAEPD